MKILLINPPVRTWAQPNCFPQGLGYIAQVLRRDHDVQVLDLNVDRVSIGSMRKRLSEMTWDAVGITGLITNYKYVKDLIRYLKEFQPHAPVIVGGALGSSIPEILLRKAGADICVIGEGEDTIVLLLRAIESWGAISAVRGIAWRVGEEVDFNERRELIKHIDNLPQPAYDLFPTEIYAENPVGSAINRTKWQGGAVKGRVPRSMNIVGSRGCPWNCSFCYHDYMGQRYRGRSAWSIMEEVKFLNVCYEVEFFLMGDDNFMADRKNVLDFCDLMEGTRFSWEAGARVDCVDRELLTRMKESGCMTVGYGIESASQKMLDRLNKKTTVEKCHRAVDLALEIFGSCPSAFIIGTPGETVETIWESIDFCKQHSLEPMVVFFLTPYPGTPLWGWMKEEGWFGSSKDRLDEEEDLILRLSDHEQGEYPVVNFNSETFSDEELIEMKEVFVKETNAWNK